MDKNMKELYKIKERELVKSFDKNNITVHFAKDKEEVHSLLKNTFTHDKKVAVGGSMTLEELDIIDLMRKSDISFIDRYEEGLSDEERQNKLREAFFADVFVTSTNALTMDGCLYNIDGTGNRVAAMIYGPKEVIVIAGMNKIFETEEEAISHIKNYSAPANALRLNKKTPCTKLGHCMECHSEDRICSSYVKLGYQKSHRIKLIIVEEDLGY